MSEQLMLNFECPGHRATDPLSSKLADQAAEDSGLKITQRQIVLMAVKNHPGATSYELSEYCGLDRYAVSRRLPELAKTRLIQKAPGRHCKFKGVLMDTWEPRGD